ncbi:Immunoglobulin superfamily member 10 [Schistosoma japonicum]|uniref:Immunoglobulin superfamily member 10 n=2 Tax=Schistosoma japonicum TaxID=6182 RepID=A0A4Z2D087_SCHJA|nr:Immunoglobulin superfamily member 10 [Schistosoma japonicum]
MFSTHKQLHNITSHFKLFIIFIYSTIFIHYFNAQYIQPGLCDGRCHCPKGESVVHCDRQDHLLGVPTNIPLGVTKLFIQQSDFPTPNYLNEANMTGLEKLEYLRIIYCNLQVIEPRTFIKMTELKHLDLSYNSLIRLESYTFYGLQLNNLYLREQHSLPEQGIFISEDSFHGLSANQINLRGNRIQTVHYEIFGKVPGLDRLILSDNRITSIDDGFERYFDSPSRLLDLTGNPLECNCRLSWIAQRSIDWRDSLPGLNMTCIHLTRTDGSVQSKQIYELIKLTADQLCPTSRIQQIFINVLEDANRALISCTAITVPKRSNNLVHNMNTIPSSGILSHTPPGVAWRYIEGGQLREVRRITPSGKTHLTTQNSDYFYQSNSSVERPSATVQLNISLDTKPRKYTCATWDDKKETEEVIVTLKGPDILNIPKSNISWSTERESSSNRNNYHIKPSEDIIRSEILFEQPHYLYQKQFTLLEMAVAVICTFLTTLIFLLIGAKCLRLCRRHTLFRLSSSCSSSICVNDSKGVVYHSAKVLKSEGNTSEQNNITPTKLNGIISSDGMTTNGYNFMQTHTNPYPQMILSTLGSNNNTHNFSPQINQHPNLSNHYLTVTCMGNGLPLPPPPMPPQQASSSVSGTDDLQQSLALLTSTPLIQQNKLRSLLTNDSSTAAAAALSPFLANTQPHIASWLVAPGSPYSVTGSHVYDVPRTLEINQGTLPMSTGLGNRSSLLSESE